MNHIFLNKHEQNKYVNLIELNKLGKNIYRKVEHIIMNITVVGAGNMGLAITGFLAIHNDSKVILFTGKKILEKGILQVNDVEEKSVKSTKNFICTEDPNTAFEHADVILVTYPAFLRKKFINSYGEYMKDDSFLGFVPGYGGAEYFCTNLIQRGITIFGLQRVPYVARATLNENGYQAGILSKKTKLYICAIPKDKTEEISSVIGELLEIPVQPLKEYLAITLAPSNPLLHITGLYNVFKNYNKGDIFEHQLKFYEEWNDETSKLLFAYDKELQSICTALYPLDMSEVVSLPIYYESLTSEDMTRKLKSIESFKAVMVPLIKNNDVYAIDLKSRMFEEDYPYGVCVIKDFAIMTGVQTPVIDLLLKFYEKISGHKYFDENDKYVEEICNTGVPGIAGLSSIQELIRFYHR